MPLTDSGYLLLKSHILVINSESDVRLAKQMLGMKIITSSISMQYMIRNFDFTTPKVQIIFEVTKL